MSEREMLKDTKCITVRKLFCGSINKHGVWTKNYFIVLKKYVRILWWSDVQKSYISEKQCYATDEMHSKSV